MSTATTTPVPDQVRALLVDGRVVTIRRLRPEDAPALLGLHRQLSERSRYLRFFSLSPVSAESFVRSLISGDGSGRAVVALLGGQLIGVASYARPDDRSEAEVALAVADPQQNHGLGTLLLEHLASLARRQGVRRFTAEVLAENARMMQVFTDVGLAAQVVHDGHTLHVTLPLEPDERYLDAVGERRADAASLRPLLRPASIAVVGASRRDGTVGRAVLANLLGSGYAGRVFAVNPRADEVLGLPAYPSVTELPTPPDLAVICVPAPLVAGIAEECGRRGVAALVVLTAGITGHPELEAPLRAAVASYGMRLVGPNCLGVAGAGPEVTFDATFAHTRPPAGPVGVVSQSGGVAIAILEQLARLGIGTSTFVSVGDKYDVSGNDLLMWWESDPTTSVGVLYMESFGNPRKFSRIARRLSRRKPLIAVRSGSSPVAQRAAMSHTAATATPAVTREALFRQAGVIAVDGFTDVVATVAVLTCQPRPAGRRVAVISNAGGAGVIAADACVAAGLELPTLSAATRDALTRLLPAAASVANPVDTTAGITAGTFAECLRAVLADGAVDGAIAICAPTALGDLVPAVTGCGGAKPLLAVQVDQAAAVAVLPSAGGQLPSFADPAVAATAYARTVRYETWRSSSPGTVPELPGIDIAAARAVVADALAEPRGDGWLDPDRTAALLTAFGVPLVSSTVVTDADQATAEFARLGRPVALKAVVPDLVHKSDQGGVLLDLADADAVRAGYLRLRAAFGDRLRGAVVQPMVTGGIELLAGVTSDAMFGPLVVFGAGGTTTDVLDDRSYRLAPVTDLDADEMVHGLRCSRLLAGYRGAPAADAAALGDVLLRIGRLADELPQVIELDLNPLVALPDGCAVLDARVRVARCEVPDLYLRRLR